MKIHHIGIAVESLENALAVFEKLLGKKADTKQVLEDKKVRVATFRLGEARLELLEATAPDSPIARFIAKRGQGVHHLALAVRELQESLVRLEGEGFRLIDRRPRRGAGNEMIAFLHPSSTTGVLTELVEES